MGHHHHHHGGHHHHHHHHNRTPRVVPIPVVPPARFHRAAPCETTPLVCKTGNHDEEPTMRTSILIILIIASVVGLAILFAMFSDPTTRTIPTPEIGLKSFFVSNLNVTDDQISANWAINLGLCNSDSETANYTDIKYTVIYCGDPSGQYIVDAHKEYGDLVLPRNNQTVVYLRDSVEKLDFNKVALSYMIMDVASDGILEFDLVVKVTVMTGNGANYRLMLSCEGIEVSISDTHNGSGSAKSHQHCYMAKVAKVE